MEKKSTGRKKSVKDEIIAGVRPKAKAKGENTTKKSPANSRPKEAKASTNTNAVTDVAKALPKEKQAVYISASQVGSINTITVDVSKITATSKNIYVADIHALNPHILTTVYWVIMPNTTHVVLRVSEQQYNDLILMKEARSMKHLVSVVDNAVFPSLSYGSWSIHEIDDFPTQKQIQAYDAKFKSMNLNFHNQPIVAEIAATSMDENDEDDFDFDFSEGDINANENGEGDDEEESFDFADETD